MVTAAVTFLVIFSALVFFHRWEQLSQRTRTVGLSLLLLFLAYCVLERIILINNLIGDLPEWDFKWYWVYGRVAALNLDFGNPESARQVAQVLNPSQGFLNELDFPFLPPTIFLFAWLGFFDLTTAARLWYVAHSVVFALNCVLLWRLFLSGSSQLGLLFVTLLLISFPGTKNNIFYAQTNFLLLLFILLFWRQYQQWSGGAWLAFAMLIKPFAALMILQPMLRRHWRTLTGLASTLSLTFLLTLAVFGLQPIVSYFSRDPSARSKSAYMEPVNQSLLGHILRISDYDFQFGSPIRHPAFILLSIALILITGWLIYRLDSQYSDWALSLNLLLALLIYPGTLTHYSILLIIPTILIWKNRDSLPGKHLAAIAFILFQYVATYRSSMIGLAFLVDWVIFVAIALYLIRETPQLQASESAAI